MKIDIKYIVYLVILIYYVFSILFWIILYRKISKGNTTLSSNIKSAIDETLSIAKSLGITNISDIFSIIDKIKDMGTKDIAISDDIAEKLNETANNKTKDIPEKDVAISNYIAEKLNK